MRNPRRSLPLPLDFTVCHSAFNWKWLCGAFKDILSVQDYWNPGWVWFEWSCFSERQTRFERCFFPLYSTDPGHTDYSFMSSLCFESNGLFSADAWNAPESTPGALPATGRSTTPALLLFKIHTKLNIIDFWWQGWVSGRNKKKKKEKSPSVTLALKRYVFRINRRDLRLSWRNQRKFNAFS